MNVRRWTWIALPLILVAAIAAHLASGPLLPVEARAQDTSKRITIEVGSFYFEGPEGRSNSTDNPTVVAQLTNNQAHTLVFENTAEITHQVVSSLFNDQSPEDGTLGKSKVRSVAPGESLEIRMTPEFLTVEDGQSLTFHLSCHVGHDTSGSHFNQGMHALLEVVPNEDSSSDDGGPY